MNRVLFSSQKVEWPTPQSFFDVLDHEFHFDLDVCALPENAKCSKFFTPEDDGLTEPWIGRCWCNPPYGRKLGEWVKKAYFASMNDDTTVVMLLPARTDTFWFHEFCLKAKEIRFVRGRLKFGGSRSSAPFPSMVVIF